MNETILWINGEPVKTPKDIKLSINDIDSDSTGRNANGDLMRDRVATKRKLEIEWGPLRQSEISKILNQTSGVFFNVRYFDAKEGLITRTFYAGDRSSPAYTFQNGAIWWSGLSMNLIEK